MSLKWWSGSKTRRLAWALKGKKSVGSWIRSTVDRERLSSGTRWTLATPPRPVVALKATVANWSFGWMETLATTIQTGTGPDLSVRKWLKLFLNPEIKAFWGLPQPSLLFYSYLTGLRWQWSTYVLCSTKVLLKTCSSRPYPRRTTMSPPPPFLSRSQQMS